MPDCVHWSADSKLACVTDENIMISTYLNKDLSRFLLHPPFLTRYFLPLPAKHTDYPEPPTLDGIHEDELDAPGTTTCRILNEQARKQSSNPREISLTKGELSMTFTAAVWGPRGSAPNMSCAIATLTSNGQVGVNYPSALDLQWKEVVSVSKHLKRHVAANDWSSTDATTTADLLFAVPLPRFPVQYRSKASVGRASDAKRQKVSAAFVEASDLVSVTSLAWSTATHDASSGRNVSYLVLCGKVLTTVWRFVHDMRSSDVSRLEDAPISTGVTRQYGWPTCCTWMHMETNAFAMGTSSGNVLLMRLTVHSKGGGATMAVERVMKTPQMQPVYAVQYSLTSVCVGGGSSITVWPVGNDDDAADPRTWVAHAKNISSLELNHCDDGHMLFSSSSDGYNGVLPSYLPVNNYPIYGLALSPNAVQLAVGYVCPPAAKPSRITQADTTYARLSSGLECFAAPNARNATLLANSLESHSSIESLGDILSYCHANLTSFNAKMAEARAWIADEKADAINDVVPLHEEFCAILESKFNDQCTAAEDPDHISPMYLQVAYQVVSNMPTPNQHANVARLQKKIMAFWCDYMLRAATKQFSGQRTRQTSLPFLLMADFLSLVASPLSVEHLALLNATYMAYGTPADKTRDLTANPTPPVRETCSLCSAPIPLTENVLEPVCDNGHALERCSRTLRVIDSVAAMWKCTVCEAFAHGDEHDEGADNESAPVLVCRLCGSYCQRVEY
ncbi:hypothetical protein DYB32_004043 [Aphanomyces invadans]|uniref:Transcription factor IIIC putative zinc-finger domain-containing protein n=1 Tax=Aphanomyces invadans TaxID=157072 RepID=A0A3R6VMY6_9STRA|nr:hypothetical protein DYB32_004043 [Aphanomyces invadans]